MKKITNIEELMTELGNGDGYFGLRGATESDLANLERGYLDCSYVWEDNEMTDEQLNGTCAIGVAECLPKEEVMKRYFDTINLYCKAHGTNTVLLLNDKSQEYGYDENEVILGSNGYGADVVAIVDIK